MSRIAQSHILKKFLKLAREIADIDLNQEIPRGELRRELPRKFRITSRDVDITMRELEQQKLLERMEGRRRVRLPHR